MTSCDRGVVEGTKDETHGRIGEEREALIGVSSIPTDISSY